MLVLRGSAGLRDNASLAVWAICTVAIWWFGRRMLHEMRTVAGRLGHSGGGTTTLKVYSAWRSEADQLAASSLGMRMPDLPIEVDPATPITGRSLDDDEDRASIGGSLLTYAEGSPAARFSPAICCPPWRR